MQRGEETKQISKSVTFDVPGGGEGDGKFMTPFRTALKEKHDAKHRAKDLKKRVYLYMREHRFDELAALLKTCTHAELSSFCDMHGVSVFRLSTYEDDTRQLDCLIRNIPQDIVSLVFRKDNFEVARSLLGVAKFKDDEDSDGLDVKSKELLAEKIHMILQASGEDVKAFIRDNEHYKVLDSRGFKLML